jgi:hypothetical protein
MVSPLKRDSRRTVSKGIVQSNKDAQGPPEDCQDNRDEVGSGEHPPLDCDRHSMESLEGSAISSSFLSTANIPGNLSQDSQEGSAIFFIKFSINGPNLSGGISPGTPRRAAISSSFF